jgi:membrane-associated phospholipid phosphatase
MKTAIVRLISNIVNPFIVSIIVLILLAFKSTTNTHDAVSWILITIAISVLPLFILILVLLRFKKLDGIFNSSRQQRAMIYIVAALLGIADCILLWFLKVPEMLFETFCAGLVAVAVFTAINHFWKISLHSAFIAAGVSILVIVFGAMAAWAYILLPMVGWSRIVLKQHTPLQVVIGALVATVVVSGIFVIFQQA